MDKYYACDVQTEQLRSLRTADKDRRPMSLKEAERRWKEQYQNPDFILVEVKPLVRRKLVTPEYEFEEIK